MATAYSTLLGLALPVQGELSGTWGDTVDNGITRYVDIAVAGTVTLTNDGAVSLSLTNGDSSATNIVSSLTGAGTVSAQFAIIKVTGTLTTAKVLTPPSSSRTYVVVNAATGSTVTVKAATQPGVSIAVGETAFVYFNGTDYVKVAGTVNTGVTSFTAGTTGFTPSTATTGAVTLAGTLATSNGGTGLSGATPFTSGGVVYASSTSALATGSALTFNGTAFATTGTGSFTGNLAVAGGAVPVASGFQNGIAVGIGGTIATRSASSDYRMRLGTNFNLDGTHTNTTTNPVSLITMDNGITTFSIGAYGTAGNAISYTDAMTLLASGNFGIGTSSPSRKLEVASSDLTDGIRLNSTQTGGEGLSIEWKSGYAAYVTADIESDGSGTGGNFTVRVADTSGNLQNRLHIDNAGNVGIGTSSPDHKLDINGSLCVDGFASPANNYITLRNSFSPSSSGGSGFKAVDLGSGNDDGLGAYGHQGIIFYSAQTERARITSGGNLLIGTTANTNSAKLKSKVSAGGVGLEITDEVSSDFLVVPSALTNVCKIGPSAGAMSFQTAGTEKARISSAGGFSVGTTADPGAGAIYATGNITAYYSDARLKTVSGKIENALDKVAQLSGVYYTNNSVAKSFGYDSDEVQVGVLAQDVEAVLPQIVKAAPFDLDQDGNSKSGENYKTVQYERLVPLLIEAINELQAKVKALEEK
jgi:hypothetical protein